MTAYQYRVCLAGSDGNCASAYSNAALGTAVTFTDPQLVADVTVVKAQHFLELRQAVDAVRFEANLPGAGWAEVLTPGQTPVRASHVEELRNRLYEALTLLRVATPTFTDPTLSTGAGGTPIRRQHVEELRLRSTRGAGTGSDGCLADEQFVDEFYQRTLARRPGAGELSYWSGRLRQAAGQGGTARLGVARELGRALFLSTEYIGRDRSISEYVSDLYWGYLGRAADSGGLAHWVNEVETHGRLKGLEAFEASGEFERRVAGMCAPPTGPEPVPTDGHTSLSYDPATNRVNTEGWEYDAAGNQTRVKAAEGVWHRYEYDAANRLVAVKTDAGAALASYFYGEDTARLVAQEGSARTYYAWGDGGVIAEYVEVDGTPTAGTPRWSKTFIYLGGRLLATQRPEGSGERVEYHHSDRLGTRVVSNNLDASYYEQTTLPFGTTLTAGENRRRFTSYDRSDATGLDHAINRSYDPRQGRFTQVDQLEIEASDLENPQSLNLYTYCGNDPVNNLDPEGLFFKKLFGFLGKLFRFAAKVLKWVFIAVAVVAAVALIAYGFGATTFAVSLLQDFVIPALKLLAQTTGTVLSGRIAGPGTPPTFPGGGGVGAINMHYFAGQQGGGEVPDCSTGRVPCSVGGVVRTESLRYVEKLWTKVKAGFLGAADTLVFLFNSPIGEVAMMFTPGGWIIRGARWGARALRWGYQGARAGYTTWRARRAVRLLKTVDDIFANPNALKAATPDDVAKLVRNDPSWIVGTLGRGSHAGQGFSIREVNAQGNLTGRLIRWHPGGGRHGTTPYWTVSSAQGRKIRIFQ